jgi:hypothetical protein
VDEHAAGMGPVKFVIDSRDGWEEEISILLNGRANSMIDRRAYGVIFAAGDFVTNKIPTE